MREIKFRVYNKTKGKMSTPFTLIDLICVEVPLLSGSSMTDEIEWLQFTGLSDRNGKESYFDDVLRWRDSTFQIIWDDECACVMLGRLSGTDGMSEIPAHNIKQGEVIGSIYEELREGK